MTAARGSHTLPTLVQDILANIIGNFKSGTHVAGGCTGEVSCWVISLRCHFGYNYIQSLCCHLGVTMIT